MKSYMDYMKCSFRWANNGEMYCEAAAQFLLTMNTCFETESDPGTFAVLTRWLCTRLPCPQHWYVISDAYVEC